MTTHHCSECGNQSIGSKTASVSVEEGACGSLSGYRAVVHESAGADRVYETTIYPSRERAVASKADAAQWAREHGYTVARQSNFSDKQLLEALNGRGGHVSLSTDSDGVSWIWAGHPTPYRESGDGTAECEELVKLGYLEDPIIDECDCGCSCHQCYVFRRTSLGDDAARGGYIVPPEAGPELDYPERGGEDDLLESREG